MQRSVTIDEVKALRTHIDGLKVAVDPYWKGGPTMLEYAKNWLGEVLRDMGNPTPYAPVTDAKDIPKTQEVADRPFEVVGNTDLEKINYLRADLETVCETLAQYVKITSGLRQVAFANSWSDVKKVSFNLGYKLAELREAATKKD